MPLSMIKTRLAKLRARDRRFRIFGSSHHKYKSIPDSTDDLERMERLFALVLPSDYQRFLFEMGHGTGPYYGVLSLFGTESEIRECFDPYFQEEAEALENLSFSSPFPVLPIANGEKIERNQNIITNSESLRFVAEFPCNGSIPICHHGSHKYTVIITTGRFKGSVWDMALDFSGSLWWSAKRPPGIVRHGYKGVELPNLSPIPTFFEWYIGWLDQCDADLADSTTS